VKKMKMTYHFLQSQKVTTEVFTLVNVTTNVANVFECSFLFVPPIKID